MWYMGRGTALSRRAARLVANPNKNKQLPLQCKAKGGFFAPGGCKRGGGKPVAVGGYGAGYAGKEAVGRARRAGKKYTQSKKI